jgi:hypothetical protein
MIDRTDFLNPVVKEKKNFEQKMIDVHVAAGLNKGIDVPHKTITFLTTGVDSTRGPYFRDEAIGIRLLSPACRSNGPPKRKFRAYFCGRGRSKLSSNTYKIVTGEHRQKYPRRFLPGSWSPVFRIDLQARQDPQNQH